MKSTILARFLAAAVLAAFAGCNKTSTADSDKQQPPSGSASTTPTDAVGNPAGTGSAKSADGKTAAKEGTPAVAPAAKNSPATGNFKHERRHECFRRDFSTVRRCRLQHEETIRAARGDGPLSKGDPGHTEQQNGRRQGRIHRGFADSTRLHQRAKRFRHVPAAARRYHQCVDRLQGRRETETRRSRRTQRSGGPADSFGRCCRRS